MNSQNLVSRTLTLSHGTLVANHCNSLLRYSVYDTFFLLSHAGIYGLPMMLHLLLYFKPFLFSGENEARTAKVEKSTRAERCRKPGSKAPPAGVRLAEEAEGAGRRIDEQPQNGHGHTHGTQHAPSRPPPEDGLRVEPAKNETRQTELARKQHALPASSQPPGALPARNHRDGRWRRQQLRISPGVYFTNIFTSSFYELCKVFCAAFFCLKFVVVADLKLFYATSA